MRLDRWWVINILEFPRDDYGWPKTAEEAPPWVGRIDRAKELYAKHMRARGISEEAIEAEWEKAKVKYGPRSKSQNRPRS